MGIWRKPLQFINVMLANRSAMSVAERGPGRMTYAKKKNKTLCRTRPARHASVRISYFVSNRGRGGGEVNSAMLPIGIARTMILAIVTSRESEPGEIKMVDKQ